MKETRTDDEIAEDAAAAAEHAKCAARQKYAALRGLLRGKMAEAEIPRLVERVVMMELRHVAGTVLAQHLAAEFGDEACTVILRYRRTSGFRGMLAPVNQALMYAGCPLTVAQVEFLCDLLLEADVSAPAAQPTVAEWDDLLEERRLAGERVLRQADARLNPVQVRALGDELELQLALLARQKRVLRLYWKLAEQAGEVAQKAGCLRDCAVGSPD